MTASDPVPEFVVGLDLGQASDYTAISIMRKVAVAGADPDRPTHRYVVSHLHRFDLGTSYPRIVEHVAALVKRPELRPPPVPPPPPAHVFHRLSDGAIIGDGYRPAPRAPREPLLVVDATGVGRAVVDMFIEARLAARLVPLTITGGDASRRDSWPGTREGGFWTPKKDIVGCVQMLLQSDRLKVVPSLPLAETLKQELMNFQVKITASANESFEARSGKHDDLVLAVAVALWVAERPNPSFAPLAW